MELDNHDLATLPDLNEEIILEYLKVRYKNDIIYVSRECMGCIGTIWSDSFTLFKTYIGDILLAINPFKQLPIYDQKVNLIFKFSWIQVDSIVCLSFIKTHRLYTNSNRKVAPPHVYALADFAYEALKNNSYNSQCCVIRYCLIRSKDWNENRNPYLDRNINSKNRNF